MKIAVFLSNRATFTRHRTLLYKMKEKFDLTLILTSSLLEVNYGNVFEEIDSNFSHVDVSFQNYRGDLSSMAAASGSLAVEFNLHLSRNAYDYIIVIADRFELLPVSMISAYKGIPIVHLQGGEVSGNIDDKVRNAVSMLADIHFVSHRDAFVRLMEMGCKHVYNTGCPSLDYVDEVIWNSKPIEKTNNILMIYHPHTKEIDKTFEFTTKVLSQAHQFCLDKGYNLIVLGCNNDPGFKYVHEAMKNIELIPNLIGEDFIRLLTGCKMIIGNSSCGIREASYLGIPSVNIGLRQEGRVRACNVIDSEVDNVYKKMSEAELMKPERSTLFGDGNASDKIIKILGDLWAKRQG